MFIDHLFHNKCIFFYLSPYCGHPNKRRLILLLAFICCVIVCCTSIYCSASYSYCLLALWMDVKTVLMIWRKSSPPRSFSFPESPDQNTNKHINSRSTLTHPIYSFYTFYSHSSNALWMAQCLCLNVISALIFPAGF